MTDYARVAETLRELKEFYTQPLTPDLECWRVHEILTTAAALCEAYAQPVDEAKLLPAAVCADWSQVAANHMHGPPCFHLEMGRFCLRAQPWPGHGDFHEFVSLADLLARARSDVRAKAAEVECERLRRFTDRLWVAWKEHCAAGYLAPLDAYQTLVSEAVYAGVESPPPTVEGERK